MAVHTALIFKSTPVMNSRRRRLLAMAGLLSLSLVCLCVVYQSVYGRQALQRLKFAQDSALAMSWEGFGPEKGQYNFTVVTGLVDIGRGRWADPLYRRTFNTYLLHMQRVLRLDVNMVLYVEPKARPFVSWMRRGREHRTHIHEVTVSDLPDYVHKERVREIMGSAQFQAGNELYARGLCESRVPEYDIVQWAKLHWLHAATRSNPFSSDYFVWIDAGYGHGNDIHPEDGVWRPRNLFQHKDRVTFIKRDSVDKFRKDAARLHKMNINIIAGLFFAGGRWAIERLYALQRELIADWLERGVVDDDQTTYMLMYYQQPELFNLVPGDWDDVFTLFN